MFRRMGSEQPPSRSTRKQGPLASEITCWAAGEKGNASGHGEQWNWAVRREERFPRENQQRSDPSGLWEVDGQKSEKDLGPEESLGGGCEWGNLRISGLMGDEGIWES